MRRALVLVLALLVACAPIGVSVPTDQPQEAPTRIEPSPTGPPSRAAPEAAGCPVTLPASAWVADLAGVKPLPASRFSWFGDTRTLAVNLPIDGVYRIPQQSAGLSAKVPWWRYVSGAVDITVRRVDGVPPEITARTSDGYGSTGFNPSEIAFASEGCWRVTGRIQARELMFVMFVRRAAPGEEVP